MTPLVVGRPCGGGLEALVALSQVVPGEVTLVWSDREELVAAVPQVLEVGGTTLLVDAQDEAATSHALAHQLQVCLLYTSPSPRDRTRSRMPSSA